MAIIYLHGFTSCGETPKTAELKARFPDELVLTPTFIHEPDQDLESIDRLVSNLLNAGETEFLLVGSSLGGFYAQFTGARLGIPQVLINPAINPHELLEPMLGEVTNFANGTKFLWEQRHLDVLKHAVSRMSHWKRGCLDTDVIIAKDDELIDVQATIDYYKKMDARLHIFDEGGHRFNNMEAVYKLIERQLASIRGHVDLMSDVDL